MSKEEFIEFEGVITELLPEGRFRVQLDNEHTILAYTAGRMKRNRIRSLVGDRRRRDLRRLRSRASAGGADQRHGAEGAARVPGRAV